MNDFSICPLENSDTSLAFMREIAILAAFVPETQRQTWRDASLPPKFIQKYIVDWGRVGDFGFVAISSDGDLLGASWFRQFSDADRGDGVLAYTGIPEVLVAVKETVRGQGVGGALMTALHNCSKQHGFRELILSVDPNNVAAIAFYKKYGYEVLTVDDSAAGTSIMMSWNIN